jgi:ABC-2 type transport system ATP-binding protein
MSELVIEARALRKRFSFSVEAVCGLDMSVPRGSVYGLIGRNGAGKTTTLRCLAGVLRPTAGTARVLGVDMMSAPAATRARFSYVSQVQQMHGWMSLEEMGHYLSFFYENWDSDYARRLAGRFDLPTDRMIGSLSGGQQRMAAMVVAFAARAEVLLLDEPAAGLDPVARRHFINAIVDVLAEGNGCTVVLSSHILSDLERIADRIGIMERGVMLREAGLDDLKSRVRRVQVIFEGTQVPTDFEIPGTLRRSAEGPVLSALVELPTEGALDALRARPDLRVSELPVSLEDLFIDLLGEQAGSSDGMREAG